MITFRTCLRALVVGLAVLPACAAGDSDVGTPPAAPRDLTVVEAVGGAHVSWVDGSDDEDEFIIERREGAAEFVELLALPFDSVVHHDATVEAGVEYAYRVMASNAAGESAHSAEVLFMLP